MREEEKEVFNNWCKSIRGLHLREDSNWYDYNIKKFAKTFNKFFSKNEELMSKYVNDVYKRGYDFTWFYYYFLASKSRKNFSIKDIEILAKSSWNKRLKNDMWREDFVDEMDKIDSEK